MKRKILSCFLAAAIAVVLPITEVGNAAVLEQNVSSQFEKTSREQTAAAQVSDLKAVYDASKGTITLTFETTECKFTKIYVNHKEEEANFTRNVYVFDDVEEGETYQFEVVPYGMDDKENNAGAKTCSVTVPYGEAVLEEAEVEYDLEKQLLLISWDGKNIASVDIYQDNVKIASGLREDGTMIDTALEPLSKHIYKLVPHNKNGAAGKAIEKEIAVEDYEARLSSFFAEYDEANGMLHLNFEGVHTKYVDILLNDMPLQTNYTKNTYSVSLPLQSGTSYKVTVLPYNGRGQAGEEEEKTVEVGSFFVPDKPSLQCVSVPSTGKTGAKNGFLKPAVNISFQAEARAHYEIYRAQKDKQGAYTWLADVTSDAAGKVTYQDKTVQIGTYYYKLRRKTVSDNYVEQQLYSGLSDENHIKISVPKPKISIAQQENGQMTLYLKSDKDFVSGFEIYKKTGSGSYKKVAVISGNTFTDTELEFAKTYSYKARAYYSNSPTGKKVYGGYSSVKKVKNTVGEIDAEIRTISSDKVKLSWKPTANAKEYEIYYKSGTKGDSYVLLDTTKKHSLTVKLSKNKSYVFMIKACQTGAKGKSYFSSAELKVKTGFNNPTGVKVSKTTYAWNAEKKELTQKDKLTWHKVYGADGYYVEKYNTIKKKYEKIATIKKNGSLSWTVKNKVTAEAKPVTYRVNAYLGDQIKKGETVTVTPKLQTPQKVSVKKSNADVKISFAPVVSAEKYRIYRSNGRSMILIAETTKTSVIDKGLLNGVEYFYYVEAVNDGCSLTSEKCEPVSYQILTEKVADLKVKKNTDGQPYLSWKKQKNAKGYVIYTSEKKDGVYKKIAETDVKTTKYALPEAEAGKTTYYKVTAKTINGVGLPAESKPAQIKVTAE